MAEPRPEPVTKAGALAGAVAALITLVGLLARSVGWLADDLDTTAVANRASDLILGGAALWAAVAPVLLALHARSKVTPTDDPRDPLGRVLVAAEQAAPTIDDLLGYLEQLRGQSAKASTVDPGAEQAEPATVSGFGTGVEGQPARHAAVDEPTPIADAALAATAAAPVVDPDPTRPMRAVAAGLPAPTPTA